jgi:hypothetical protein
MLCLSYYCLYSLFKKKLEIRAEQILPESKVGESWWGSGGEGEEMAQTMYAHMNKQEKIGKNSKNKYILVLKKKKRELMQASS